MLVIRLFLTMAVSCYGCFRTMQVLDAHTALGMQMLEFLDVPLYWKFMMVTGWNGSINGLTEDVDVPKYRWFLPPNCEQVRLSTDLDGIGIIYLLRGERDASGVMRMTMCEMVLERRSGAGQFVDEIPESGRCGLAPELPVGLSRRCDHLYKEFCLLAQREGNNVVSDRALELAGLCRSLDKVHTEIA